MLLLFGWLRPIGSQHFCHLHAAYKRLLSTETIVVSKLSHQSNSVSVLSAEHIAIASRLLLSHSTSLMALIQVVGRTDVCLNFPSTTAAVWIANKSGQLYEQTMILVQSSG